MARSRHIELTEAFFAQCDAYLAGQRTATQCAKQLRRTSGNPTFSTNTFLHYVNEAYNQRYLVLTTKSDDKAKNALLTYINSHLGKVIIPHVAAGKPSHDMFALFAAECVINILKELLAENRPEISLGVVSGTSVCETIRQIVESALWDGIIGPDYEVGEKLRKINILTLSIPPAVGEDLYGNAIASVVSFARFLSHKLPQPQCTVVPYGMMSPLIVNDLERARQDIINSKQLEIVDPRRLENSRRRVAEAEKRKADSVRQHEDIDSAGQAVPVGTSHDPSGGSGRNIMSSLDMVLFGAGPRKKQSVFTTALKTADIAWPEEAIGDVGFIPMKRDGEPAQLYDAKEDEVFVYGLLSAQLMRELVSAGRKVVLIARNSRLIKYTADSEGMEETQKTDKVGSIKAAIRGGFCNFLITDKAAAEAIMKSEK